MTFFDTHFIFRLLVKQRFSFVRSALDSRPLLAASPFRRLVVVRVVQQRDIFGVTVSHLDGRRGRERSSRESRGRRGHAIRIGRETPLLLLLVLLLAVRAVVGLME